MKRVASGILPAIAIDRTIATPLHRQIYDAFRATVIRGELRPAQRVPSTRELARELGISRFPVVNAYAQLLTEGYLKAQRGSGTVVSRSLPDRNLLVAASSRSPARGKTEPLLDASRTAKVPVPERPPWLRGRGAFRVGQIAEDEFPFKIWAKLTARSARNLTGSSLWYGDVMGHLPLREAIAGYLRTSRRLRCDASQVMIVSGSQQGLLLCGLVLLSAKTPVWVEEPGYGLARDALRISGCEMVPVPVDSEGLNVRRGIRACPKAKAALVTPSHQFPLGMTMSLGRRLELLNWASSTGAWIIEDDYDSEFRFESPPLASLQGLDVNGRVIYVGSFSKVLFPSLRIGYLVLPQALIDSFQAIRHTCDLSPPNVSQEVLKDFIVEGHFGRHLRRMRMLYASRRSALVQSLQQEVGPDLKIFGDEAGLQLVVGLPPGTDDNKLSMQAAQRNLWLWPLSRTYLSKKPRTGFLLGFGGTPAEEIPGAVRTLAALIAGERKSS